LRQAKAYQTMQCERLGRQRKRGFSGRKDRREDP
jgi:hypothetical protein